jgi:hypothetical protein
MRQNATSPKFFTMAFGVVRLPTLDARLAMMASVRAAGAAKSRLQQQAGIVAHHA